MIIDKGLSFAVRKTSFILLIFFFITGLSLNPNVLAQNSEIDPTFDPEVAKDVTSDVTGNIVLQPDGKILIYGVFGTGGTYLKRLNTDGSTDTTFDCSVCKQGVNIASALVSADGKIIVTGFTDVAKMYRLNSDGTLDVNFNVSPNSSLGLITEIEVEAVQPDGKVLVRHRSANLGYSMQEIFRYNSNGTEDASFTKTGYGPFRFSRAGYSRVFVQPDGKILIGGTISGGLSSSGFIYRTNADGTRDETFEPPTFSDNNDNRTSVGYFDVFPDASIIVPGDFKTVNSLARTDLVKVLPAGNVDLNFDPGNTFEASDLHTGKAVILPDGKFLVSAVKLSPAFPVEPDNRFYRFNPDGTLDTTIEPPAELTQIDEWTLDSSNRILVFGQLGGITRYLRLNSDGSLDTTYNPTLTKRGIVNKIAVQPDGKVLIYGDFNRIGGTIKNNFARINSDGTLDPTFDAGSGFDVVPAEINAQADGKILAIGDFTSYDGTSVSRFVRLNSDGSLDTSFSPTFSSSVVSVVSLANGQILVGGSFATVNGNNQPKLAKLNSDGSLDASFAPVIGSGTVRSIFVESGGQIIVAGAFSGVNGFNRSNLVRLNSDGSLDTGFNAGSVAAARKAIGQPDGKYLLLQPAGISRRNSDGSADGNFQMPAISGDDINTILLQSDGKILVGGSFASPRFNFARFLSDGTLDTNFLPASANNKVNALAEQVDGKILIGGNFILVGSVLRSGIGRIINKTLQKRTPFDFDGDGRSDVSVYRPATKIWYAINSGNDSVLQENFGDNGDILAPGDYDGDGQTDPGIFRPSTGSWWYLSSVDGLQKSAQFGAAGDIPMPSDIDGDGADDFVLFRPSKNVWYRATSDDGSVSVIPFGAPEDKPMIGDFDGDGKADPAVFRPSDGNWWYLSSLDGAQKATKWGLSDDIPVPADYDGDGQTDLAVYRPSEGGWYISNSGGGEPTTLAFGISTDVPVPADYDGDGKADIAVFRPSTGVWYLLQSTNGFAGLQFGVSTDRPIPGSFNQ